MDAPLNFADISAGLLALFPDDRVTRDLNSQLFEGLPTGNSVSIKLDGLELLEIPPSCRHEVCSVVFQRDLFPASEHVRVFCAVGGVKSESHGIIEPNLCFAVLKYNQDGVLSTYDLYASQFS
jgi:hypothetical protein